MSITNWKKFKELSEEQLKDACPPIDINISNSQIDFFVNQFAVMVNSCKEVASEAPKFKFHSPYFDLVVRALVKIKHYWQRKLKKIFHQNLNRNTAEYREISNKVHEVNLLLQAQIRRVKAENFQKFLEDLPPNHLAFKKIYAFLSVKTNCFCSEISVDNTISYDSKEIANKFREHFSKIYCEVNVARETLTDVQNVISEKLSSVEHTLTVFNEIAGALGENSSSDFTISVDLVRSMIKNLNSKKSFGPDNISNVALKNLPESGIRYLTILFNHCINNGYFPVKWKSAKIIPIKKRHPAVTTLDYRPISLLSNVGKLFEKILLLSLEDYTQDCIPKFQFGFRKAHSTVHALLKFSNDILLNLRKKRSTVAVSLDIEKAFDTVFHKGLLYKLCQVGIPPVLVKIISSFLTDRTFM